MILVQDLDPGAVGDIGSGHDTRPLGRDRQALGAFDIHAKRDALEVENDICHVFTHTGNA